MAYRLVPGLEGIPESAGGKSRVSKQLVTGKVGFSDPFISTPAGIAADSKNEGKHLKSQLREWLSRAEFQPIVAAAMERGRTINILITLTYDEDPLTGWRAVEAVGKCAESMAPVKPEALKNQLRRLFWFLSDESGAIAWRAPEIIGEIIRSDPAQFAEFIPLAVGLLSLEPEDLPRFLPGILYGLGRIGEADPAVVKERVSVIEQKLADPDPQARAMAVWCLDRIGAREVLARHPELGGDESEAQIYRNGFLEKTSVSRLRAEALR
jgi:hypothetical protein